MRFVLGCCLLLPLAGVRPALAQEADPDARPPAASRVATAEPCETGPISFVFIDNHSIFDLTDPELDRRFTWAYAIANTLHIQTRRWVIRRQLLFAVGDCYDPLLIAESERLLRAHDFLSRVDIFGVPQPDGSYHVVVDTQDEWSTQVDLRVRLDRGLRFEGIRVREANLLGTGQSVGFFFLERDVTRDYGIAYHTPQVGRTRWRFGAAAGRTRAGTLLDQSMAYPFLGEFGRWAALQRFAREDRFFDYVADDQPGRGVHVLVPLREQAFDLAAMRRFGRPGRLTLLGAALTYRRLAYPGADSLRVVHGDDFDDQDVAGDELAAAARPQLGELDNLRALAILGRRNITWVRRRGLDSMRGVQDVRLGADIEFAFGRSLPLAGMDDDLYASLDAFAAAEVGRTLVAARVSADARNHFDDDRPASFGGMADNPGWEDMRAHGEMLLYLRPAGLSNHTLLLRAAGTGGWQTRTPYQLTLGGDHALRGYAPERFPGGRRLVLTLEDRVYFGWPLRDVLDLGGTVFLDAGRMWPGDVPYGRDSGWRASAGLGLRAALPAGGRTTYRLDFAMPVDSRARLDDLRLIVSVGELVGLDARGVDPRAGGLHQRGVSSRSVQRYE